MARKVTEAPAGFGKRARLPDEWFDGSIWEIVPGEDLRSPDPERTKRQLYATARERGFWVRIEIADGKVYMQRRGRR